MKKQIRTFAMFAAVCGIASFSTYAADIERVIVRQQWPWSTDVEVEYMLSGVTDPVDINVQAYDGNQELPSANLAGAITGEHYGISRSGTGCLTIDPVKAFGTANVNIPAFRVRLTLSASAANINDIIYKIFDLTNNCACTDVTRADLLNGKYGAVETDFGAIGDGFNTSLDDVIIWTGVTNDIAYKTTHLVMRKIPAKGKTFTMGQSSSAYYKGNAASEIQHEVSFTNDYYAGVFELTYGQATNISRLATPATSIDMYFTDTTDNALRALTTTAVAVRGDIANWPDCGRAETQNACFVKKLRDKTGLMFDLPTDAIWEYACRAGTETDFNCGVVCTKDNWKALHNMISRNVWNSSVKAADLSTLDHGLASDKAVAVVGSYAPNAYGLYDMHGNLFEWCLDSYVQDLGTAPVVDPWGGTANAVKLMRGGAFYLGEANLTSSSRFQTLTSSQKRTYTGARLFIVLP